MSVIGQPLGKRRVPPPFHLYMPPRPRRPLLVLIHGVSTPPERLIEYAVAQAARHGVPLLAPDFSAVEFAGYQRLKGHGEAFGAAHALQAATQEVMVRYGLAWDRFDLLGFSAGAQFAHRFALRFPELVRRLIVASAGWHTYLDRRLDYPLGVGTGEAAPSNDDLHAFLQLPILVAAGERDTGRDKHLRTGPELDRRQGRHRLERAQRWFHHLSEEALKRGLVAPYAFHALPNTGHSLREAVRQGGLMDRSFDFLLEPERSSLAQSADRARARSAEPMTMRARLSR